MSIAKRTGYSLVVTGLLATSVWAQPVGHDAPAGRDPAAGRGASADHAGSGHVDAGGHASRPLLSFDPAAALWSIAVFSGLFLVLYKAAWPQILTALQNREKFIHDTIESARREREEADRLLAKYREQIDHARMEATAIVEEGRRDGEAVRRRVQEEARAEADEALARARREIELAGQVAMKTLYDQTADLVVHVASRVVTKTLGDDDHRRLISEAIERVRTAGAGSQN